MQRDYCYTAARDWRSLDDIEEVGRKAAEKALQRLGADKLSTRKAPVLFAPELARGLIGHFVGAIGGAAQYRRSSFLLDAGGQQVFPEAISLIERPHLPGALGSAPFDGEGVATRDRELVVDGVLDGYLLDSYSARKLGLVTTGNAGGVHNLVVQGADARSEDAAPEARHGPARDRDDGAGRQPGDGRLLARRLGILGRERRGHAPRPRNHRRRQPARMFLGIVAQGDDVDRRGAIHCGSLLIDEMTIAGD